MSTSISEFERTKPTVTMAKLNDAIQRTSERRIYAESSSEEIFLNTLLSVLKDTVQSLKKGE